jgi:hypothetical protein
MALGFGIGIPFIRRRGAAIDAQAQAHFDRVIADGGLVPSGLSGVNAFFTTIKTIYATSDITTAISVGLDAQVLGYKLGAGAGTTLGQAAQKLYSCSGASGDVVQTTAASQPLLLVHEGANYWFGSGVSGNDVSAGVIAPVATLELDVKVQLNGGNALPTRTIISQDSGSGGNRIFSFEFANATTGTLGFFYNSGFGGYQVSSVGVGLIANYSGWIRVTYLSNGATATITFYSSTNGTTWTTLSTHSGLISIGLGTSNSSLRVGSNNGANLYQGKIVYASISNVIDGTPTRIFNPNQYNAATSQTQWTSSTGEVWTINTGTAATGYKGVLVDRTITMGDGIDDRLTSNVIRTNILTQYLAANPFTNDNSGNSVLIDANNGAWLNSIVAFSSNIGNIMNSFASDLLRSRTPNRLILATSLNNQGVRNSISVNNGAETLNTYSPCPSGNGLNIFSRTGGGTFGNAIINTYISTNGQNNSTVRTAMYDYIKSINNNAF